VTHGVFPYGSWRSFLVDKHGIEVETQSKGFYEFAVTDSLPAIAAALDGQRPFVVLTVADAVCSMMHGKLLPGTAAPAQVSHL
jgi:hypothetical protein